MDLDITTFLQLPSTYPMAAFSCLIKWMFGFLSLLLPPKYIKKLAIIIKTLPRDLKALRAAVFIVSNTYYHKVFNCTVTSEFQKLARRNPERICFRFLDRTWTFREVEEYSNRVAHVFHNAGYRKGDVIALYMSSCPEYACIWLGLGKIGVITALINTNLKQKSLKFCIGVGGCKAVIFSNDLSTEIQEIRHTLESTIRLFQLGDVPREGISSLDNAIKWASPQSPKLDVKINYRDHLLYIYTSGTTGFPKAAIMPHARFLLMSMFSKYLLRLTKHDIVYNPLPLYHTAGGLLGIGTAITIGASVVIRPKFSASAYIQDCVKYRCTVAQYIGEICRYILAVPPAPNEKDHCLRIIVGNGLRASIWAQFTNRFNISNVMEIYGSTEGNLLIANLDNKIGAVGAIPRLLPLQKYIGSIIKVDPDTMEPIRNKDGFCIECDADEPGMFVGVIPFKGSMKDVYGYVDKKESSKKIIYDVFKKGDRAFVSGDIMVMDELGYLYFRDRTGDTFRWKGENVSTSEVEALISSEISLTDCVVYGVKVGELEGQAGMLAVVDPKNEFNFEELVAKMDKILPKFQQPLFVRILPEIEMTGTFKLKKINLQKEGFNPHIIKDPLYFKKGRSFVRLTNELYEEIISGAVAV